MLLYKLSRRGIPTGLVTGNLTRIGWKKMERAGLRRYLRFGAFAERASDLRKAAGPEHEQGDDENDDELRGTETEHGLTSSKRR